MSLTATYDASLSRVELAATSLGSTAVYAIVEYSLNSTLWLPVRGGSRVPVVSQVLGQLRDYEFPADIATTYRVRSFNSADVLQQTFTTTITASLGGHGWLKSISYPFLNRKIVVTDFSPTVRPSRSAVHSVAGRSVSVATHDLRGGREFELEVMTETIEQAGVLDLVLAAGGTMFIHTPPGCRYPGGYVAIGDTSQGRRTRSGRSDRRYTSLPCVEVAAPSPLVVGAELTWATVRRLYGDSWAAARAANPTLPWSAVGDPEDLVVL